MPSTKKRHTTVYLGTMSHHPGVTCVRGKDPVPVIVFIGVVFLVPEESRRMENRNSDVSGLDNMNRRLTLAFLFNN